MVLARSGCRCCLGFGWSRSNGVRTPCACVLRKVFSICWNRWQAIVAGENWNVGVSRQREEYVADVILVSRRALVDPLERLVFRAHFVLGIDSATCASKLNLERGKWETLVRRVEARLGRAYWDTDPYPLYPVNEYFSARRRA
jgi:hypothetical protein